MEIVSKIRWADYTAGAAGPRGISDWLRDRSGGSRSWVYPWKPGDWQMPVLPNAPATSTAVVLQPLCSHSAQPQYSASSAGLPSSIVAVAGETLTSASRLRRPSGSTSAPSSLASTITRRSISSTGLPRSSSSALVGRQPAIASGLLSFGCASSLRLRLGWVSTRHRLWTPFFWLCLVAMSHRLYWAPFFPPASPWSSVTPAPPRISASVARAFSSTLAPRIIGIPLSLVGYPSSTRLLCHLFRHRQSAPWSRLPFLLHGSSLCRLHRGPSLWLGPGPSLAPPVPAPSCRHPGSFLLCCPPGLCLPAPSRVSVLLQSHLPSCHPSLS